MDMIFTYLKYYTMKPLLKCKENILAILANRKVGVWNRFNLNTLIEDEVAILDTSPSTGLYAALTLDGRIYANISVRTKPIDITRTIRQALGNCSPITKIFVDDLSIIAFTDTSLCIVSVLYRTVNGKTSFGFTKELTHKFPHKLNLISFGDSCAFMRTSNNDLYCLSALDENWTLVQVSIPGIELISKIVCSPYNMFMIANDGTVRSYNWLDTSQPPVRIGLPEGTTVTKIVITQTLIFYITSTGGCWYNRIDHVSQQPYPLTASTPSDTDVSRRRTLANFSIENVLEASTFIIFQYSGGRMVTVAAPSLRFMLFKKCYTWATLVPFNDKRVESIINSRTATYFTASDGSVYHCDSFSPYAEYEEVPVFENNPVLTESTDSDRMLD